MQLGVIDFHAHMPWWLKDPRSSCRRLLLEADSAGVERLVVIGVAASEEEFRRRITPKAIVSAAHDSGDLLLYSGIPYISRMVADPEEAARWHVEELRRHTRRVEDVVECASIDQDRIAPVASYEPDRGPRGFAEAYKRYAGGLLGVKIFPTFHFLDPASTKLDPVYRAVAEDGGLVIVHTGCDPGVFEFPAMCSTARPSRVEEAARRHRDVAFIIAHLGAYSALKPGIYFEEALRALDRDNVYADTSAVDPLFVEKAVEEVGAEKILYGSDYPYVAGQDMGSSIDDILSLRLSESEKRAILRENAIRLLKEWTRWGKWAVG